MGKLVQVTVRIEEIEWEGLDIETKNASLPVAITRLSID